MGPWTDLLQACASAATALGVGFAGLQLWLTKRQATTGFEDGLAREYREVAQKLPVRALLGEDLDPEALQAALDEFYHYIDLSNEQVFLRANDRVSLPAWRSWCEGIKSNLERPAFRRAWEHIQSRAPTSFQELRRLEAEKFISDPKKWH